MKQWLFIGFFMMPMLLLGQVRDSLRITHEIDSLIQLNKSLVIKFKLKEAFPVIESAMQKAADAFGKESAVYADCLFGYGLVLQQSGKMKDAENTYLEVKDIRAKALGTEHLDYAKALNNLGLIYLNTGKYAAAEPLFLDSKRIREKQLGKNNADYAKSANNLGALYFRTGRLAMAEPLLLEARDIWAKTIGTKHADYANSVQNLGAIYQSLSQYEKAEPFLLESLAIREQSLGKNNPDYAASAINLGTYYSALGRYESAESAFQEALSALKSGFGKDRLEYRLLLNNMGANYVEMGEYEKAEPLYLEAKNLYEQKNEMDGAAYASTLNNMANAYFLMGRLDEAEALNLSSVQLLENSGKTNYPEYLLFLNNLGNIYLGKNKLLEAEKIYLKVLSLMEKNGGKQTTEYATCLSNLGTTYVFQNQREKALQTILEAKTLLEKIWGTEHPKLAQQINNIALLSAVLDLPETAEPLFLKALELANQGFGTGNDFSTRIHHQLAAFYAKYNRYEAASDNYILASQFERKKLANVARYASERDLSKFTQLFSFESDNIYALAEQSLDQNPALIETCYDNALFFKGFLLQAASSLQNMIRSDTAASRLDHLHKAYLRLLSKEYTKPIKERNKKQLSEWEEKANSLEKEMVQKLVGYESFVQEQSWQEVQKQLSAGEAAIELIRYDYLPPDTIIIGRYYTNVSEISNGVHYAALVLLPAEASAKAASPHFIPLFEERQLQALLNQPGASDEVLVKDLYGNSPDLANLLWKPLENILKDVKIIYYSPAGLLHRINPAALLDASGESLSSARTWVRVGSTRELVTGRLADQSFAVESTDHQPSTVSRKPSTVNQPSAVILGGINYSMDSLAFTTANPLDNNLEPDRHKDGNFRYIAAETRGESEGEWKALPGSAREADEVGALLRKTGFTTDVQKGYLASEERIKQLGANGTPSPRILHLATHGFAYPDPKKEVAKGFGDNEPVYKLQDDPMLRSGLLLAGSNFYWKNKHPLTNREDGVLVAYEVRDMNLRNTELAVLSACQTGLGDVVGSEGVYGLQRAFRIAGAKFLIVSLWQVPDEKTQELMRLFYQNWAGKKQNLRAAFNNAQQEMREKDSNPFVWAGFVLIE